MINILALEGWSKEGSELEFTKDDFDLKYLELYASELHNSVEEINKLMSSSKYVIDTLMKKFVDKRAHLNGAENLIYSIEQRSGS